MISYKYNCIFVHIPKTGGTSIEDLIWPSKRDRTESNLWMGFVDDYHNKYQTGGLQHLFATQIRQEVGDGVFDKFFKFTIVRNPWDRAVSQYVYMKRRKDLRQFIGMNEDDCFKKYLSLIQKTKHVQWEPQYKFYLDENGEQLVDYIGRLESITEDVDSILSKVKLKTRMFGLRKQKVPHRKKSVRGHYRDYMDKEAAEMVQKIYKNDIELLGYSF